MKIGFLGLGVMGLPMAKNVVKKCGCPVLGYDVAEARLAEFKDFGGEVTSDPDDIYRTCDVVMQILPTHPIIIHSVERAIELGKPGNIIIDLSSTAPDIVLDLHKKALDAGMFLLDCPVSGGNPMAIAGTLAMMPAARRRPLTRRNRCCPAWGTPSTPAAAAAAASRSWSTT